MFERILEKRLLEKAGSGKAIILMGARQVGKTTILRKLFDKDRPDVLWLNGDEKDVQ